MCNINFLNLFAQEFGELLQNLTLRTKVISKILEGEAGTAPLEFTRCSAAAASPEEIRNRLQLCFCSSLVILANFKLAIGQDSHLLWNNKLYLTGLNFVQTYFF